MAGPLTGVRILDLTTVVMGPMATQLLADLGAEVIKIENPGGDSVRWIGPARNAGMGPLFLQSNRNKKSVVLDLKDPEQRAQLLELSKSCDVLVYNIRPQAMDRLGLSYEAFQAVNPQLIYAAAVGYGSEGPKSGRAVYDDLMQAAAGIAGLFGEIDGKPRYAPVNICDRTVGLYLANAITAALYARTKTGIGQAIEVPMLETMVQFVLGDHMAGHAYQPPIDSMGYRRLKATTRGPYPTKDGHLCIVLYSNAHWTAFSDYVGDAGLLERDARFSNQTQRTIHATEAGAYIATHMPKYTTEEWLAFCDRADIPAEKVAHIEDLPNDPHLKAVGMFVDIEHPTEGLLRTTRFPIKFSETPAELRHLAPNLGEHTDEVLATLDLREKKYAN